MHVIRASYLTRLKNELKNNLVLVFLVCEMDKLRNQD
jgi:hypothetical protein